MVMSPWLRWMDIIDIYSEVGYTMNELKYHSFILEVTDGR